MFRRILICDDLKWSSGLLKQIIYRTGEYVVVEAENLDDAKEIIENRRKDGIEFDFVVTSISFDKEKLFLFLEEIMSDGFEGEVAIAGAAGLEDDVIKRALSLKVRKFLTKPYKESEVRNFL